MTPVRLTVAPPVANSTANTRAHLSWSEANQNCLVMEFACLRHRLDQAGLSDANEVASNDLLEDSQHRLLSLRAAIDPPTAIDQLAVTFDLSTFEREILLLCAGIEMDSTLAAQCSHALGSQQRRGTITFALALATLRDPHWSALAPSAPLRRFRLIDLEQGLGLTSAPLRIDERILHYLAGVNQLDTRLDPFLQTRQHPHWIAEEHTTIALQIAQSQDLDSTEAPILHLYGDDPRGQEDVAAIVAREAGRQLLILPLENLPASVSADSSEFETLWPREASLLPALLLIQCGTATPSAPTRRIIERLPAPLILASRDPLRIDRPSHRQSVSKPSPASQKHLWTKALSAMPTQPLQLCAQLDNLAEQFRLSAETIFAVGSTVSSSGVDHGTLSNHKQDQVPNQIQDQLWSACRSLSRPRLEDHAQRIHPTAAWDDLILPEPQKQTLRQLAAQARHRMTVYESWGFAANGRRGLGITALFAGASGTGKTLAAEVLAKELHLDVYRIDLSAVVSKYIGESEKNLKQVFDAAEEGGVVLLFDEADALFGKRAEIKDSHDRYANIEVSYLLQRMETFQGIALLTTNFKLSMDKAFQRRMRFTIDFPFPGPAERAAIWQRAFPAKTPTNGLSIERLAQLNMTGGNIRNIALNAAFFAAEAGTDVLMQHILQATRQEAIKIERPLAEAEIRGWV